MTFDAARERLAQPLFLNTSFNLLEFVHLQQPSDVKEDPHRILSQFAAESEAQRTIASEAIYIRRQLKAANIDPDKVPPSMIGYMELLPSPKGSDATMGKQYDKHAGEVACVMNCNDWGLIHNAQVSQIRTTAPGNDIKLEDYGTGPDALKRYIVESSVATMNGMTDRLQKYCIDGRDPIMHVLNMSLGASSVNLCEGIMENFFSDPKRFQPMIEQFLGADAAQWIEAADKNRDARELLGFEPLIGDGKSTAKLYQAVLNYVDGQLGGSAEFQNAMKRYQGVTQKIAESGLTIVVSAGNEGQFEKEHQITTQPGDRFNWFAMSDYVISVGGSDNRQVRIGDLEHYDLAQLSSPGADRFHPTILAPAVSVPVGTERTQDDVFPIRKDGTSFAAPLTSAVIAVMLMRNPFLTFAQQKQLLQKHAVRLAGVPTSAQGAGELDATASILDAASN